MKPATTYEMLMNQPHHIEAEQSVLGGLMLDNACWSKVESMGLKEFHFYREDHRLIFRAIAHVVHSEQPIDIITLQDYLKSINSLQEAGGLAYLASMAKDTPSAANISAYARIVKEKALLREIIATGLQLQTSAMQPDAKPAELVNDLYAATKSLSFEESTSAAKWCGLSEGLSEIFEDLDRYAATGIGGLLGISTGLVELDQKIAGLEKAKLYLVGGRPGMGKSTLAFNFAAEAAIAGKNVAVFSLEMPKKDIFKKLCSSLGSIDYGRLRNQQPMEELDYQKLSAVTKKLKGKLFSVDDTGGISPAYIRNKLNQLTVDTGRPIDLVVIDYVQLMNPSSSKAMDANSRIADIGKELMQIKKEFDCPLVLLSQLNRAVEQRPNKRPINADLRDSGSLEQDADVILFIYRDEVYDAESADKGIAEIIIAKQRAGELGTIRTRFEGRYQRFSNDEGGDYGL